MSASRSHRKSRSTAAVEAQSRELYRQAFLHSNEAIALLSPDGHYVEQNAAHRSLLGYSDDELYGETPAIHMGEKPFAEVQAALRRDGEYRGEIISHTKTGDARQIELSAFAMNDASGKPLCYVGLKRDITDRRRTEQQLNLQYVISQILSNGTSFVGGAKEMLKAVCDTLGWEVGTLWTVDRESARLVFVDLWHTESSQVDDFVDVCSHLRLKKGDGLPGRIWESLQPVWVPDVTKEANFPRATIAGKHGLMSAFGFPVLIGNELVAVIEFFNLRMTAPDEELLEMMSSIGAQIGQFLERKRAEGELAHLLLRERSARAEAEQANRLKDEFLATVSHELRTPLNAIMGWTRMVRSGRLDSESIDHALEVIERNSWAQKQIIEDILDVSRVITGKLQLDVAPVNVVTVIEAALDAVRPALEAKQIKIQKEIEPKTRVVVSGDADRLQQVIWNLLSNAAKFTPSQGHIKLSLKQQRGSLLIQVTDTGPGIEPSFLPYIFERFRQADGSTTRTHGGLGLGLAIVRHLVELHGGTITAQNLKKGTGAVFTVSLPLPSGELRMEDVPASPQSLADVTETTPDLSGVKILLVDDESDSLDFMNIELTRCGAQVVTDVSAAEALTTLEKANFDLIISDIGMPAEDGYAFIRKVRAREAEANKKKTPAIALTAYARVQDRMRALIAGYDTHVAKPIETTELLTVVASVVGRLAKK